MVMGKLKKQPMPTCPAQLELIVRQLFPEQHPLNDEIVLTRAAGTVCLTTASEVLEIAATIKVAAISCPAIKLKFASALSETAPDWTEARMKEMFH